MIRLLTRKPDDDDDDFKIVTFRNNDIPPYAILSHTWTDGQEVTYKELVAGTGKAKAGFAKIRFCGERAAQDGYQYFWVDTCCIDKSNQAELQEAISSMFQWYRHAAKCYVYLADVSTRNTWAQDLWMSIRFSQVSESEQPQKTAWQQAFRNSRWFKRGWTLQELLAPALVEFFSKDGCQLGDKQSLKEVIHEITGLPNLALQGSYLSQFSVTERFRWIELRETKHDEDRAYSLLGIFGVSISLHYGEGGTKAFERLRNEIDKLERCIRDLYITDPIEDKKRIEEAKGGLLKDSYRWVLQNPDFLRWRINQESRLLWINGEAGKGKTMLLCGIIDALSISIAKTALLSYFFCQATNSQINSAAAVLRGLTYMLVKQQPSLASHIRRKYDHIGKTVFEDTNARIVLSEILINILQDPSLNRTYIFVDALDECVKDLPELLKFIVMAASQSPRVKWIVSGRNWPVIAEDLNILTQKVRLCLELNAESISSAVATFIEFQVDRLATRKGYSNDVRTAVHRHLTLNAEGTFLWVALVCKELADVSDWIAEEVVQAFPPGLKPLYRRMLSQICTSRHAELCKSILAVILTVKQPITLDELPALVDVPPRSSGNYTALEEIIRLCGSFLGVQNRTISVVHQSAKDFLIETASADIFPSGLGCVHHSIFVRSLTIMTNTLRRDIYGLKELGFRIEDIKHPDPDPLAESRYACVFWIEHLLDWISKSRVIQYEELQDGGKVEVFMREKYLYWLEALSICRRMSEGVMSVAKLEACLQAKENATKLSKLIHDAHRFILYHKFPIENNPIQAYISALLFSPSRSLIKSCFRHEEPKEIIIRPEISEWSACLQTLEGHDDWVESVAFSHDSTRLASASYDRTVKIWDTGSGACLQTLEGHDDWVKSVAFSHDSTRLASASFDRTVKIWDTGNGACLQTLEGHDDGVKSVAFSHDSTRLASASDDRTVKIWDTGSGACLQTLEGHDGGVKSVAFSHDSTRLASASDDRTVKIWDTGSGACLQTLEGHDGGVESVAFSHDSTRLASASYDRTVKIWDTGSGACLQTLEVGTVISQIFFNITGSCLHTNIGVIALSIPSASSTTKATIKHSNPQHQSVGLSLDRVWITYNSQPIIWLPSEYRPSSSAILGRRIGVGGGSGKRVLG